jgi:hypothetical protein
LVPNVYHRPLMSILANVLGDIFKAKPAPAEFEDPRLRVFVGYDHRQSVAYNVLQHSLHTRSSRPVSITPLALNTLPMTRQGLTPFTFSRFLVPWLCGFRGVGLFLDLDMLIRGDIAELFGEADEGYAASVVKNSERFEWASAILFNCGHPANAVLTPDYVDDPERCVAPHMLDWLHEDLVGSLPPAWNHTVGYDATNPQAKLVHYTQGVPHHPEVAGCEFEKEWIAEREAMCASWNWTSLMANSVHAAALPNGARVPKLALALRAQDVASKPTLDFGAVPSSPAPQAAVPAQERDGATDRYKQLVELYKDMHTRGDTINGIPADKTFDGRSLVGHLDKIGQVARDFDAKTMLDYGCGKALSYNGAVQLADGRVVDDIKAHWSVDEITLYDPGYAPYSNLPTGKFDGVVSTDVLEHCPIEDIHWIVGEMFSYAEHFVYLTISCRLAVKHLPNGENAHITVKPPEWWADELAKVSKQNPNVRYFATCYGPGNDEVLLRG